jgi:hypothetical protein
MTDFKLTHYRGAAKIDKITGGGNNQPSMQTAEKTPIMKMPLKYGIPLLIALWLGAGFVEYGQGKTLLMVLAMGVAMWTAFSLPRPRRRQPEEFEDGPPLESAPPPEDGDSATADGETAPEDGDSPSPTNGSGRPISRSVSHSGTRSESES